MKKKITANILFFSIFFVPEIFHYWTPILPNSFINILTHACRLHPTSGVHCVPKKAISRHLQSNNSSTNWTFKKRYKSHKCIPDYSEYCQNLPECIPIRKSRFSFCLWRMLNFETAESKWRDMVAISAACWLLFLSGKPLTWKNEYSYIFFERVEVGIFKKSECSFRNPINLPPYKHLRLFPLYKHRNSPV